MSRPFSFMEGEYYHIFNRGVEKRIVFENARGKERFQKLLYLCNGTKAVHFSEIGNGGDAIYQADQGRPIIAIGAYCLMSSHFHLLVRGLVPAGISQFMQKLITAYTMYFNIRNHRSGVLFESRFRARHVKSDEYLKYLYSYIHLNPVEHIEPNWKKRGIKNPEKVKQYLADYQYSSFLDYCGARRPEIAILKMSDFPSYFKTQAGFLDEIESWLEFQPEKPLL